ncbi:type II toxin-antitoxin system RelE/ParE family toxin [Rhodoferax bucti]|uniref:type II toxin-antitoxin system RelE/ParE family toxin n=1 Tax=Rhodoferax bucti TaxID=2576305 RepID=UPI0011081FC2|nr:type II toxin-antitoxin system RelE/ParE family toxin [Rhodoferax bucti]
MKIKILAEDAYQVVGVMDGDLCPAENFLLHGDASTAAARGSLLEMIGYVAEHGLHGAPSAWFHEANKAEKIYEFIKGPLRLFFFKGEGNQVAICTTGVRKSGQKADKSSVSRAAKLRTTYFEARANNTCEVIDDEAE